MMKVRHIHVFILVNYLCLFQEKMNVHLYFDKEQGAWVRLPLGWELHSDFVKQLMATVHVIQSLD